MTRRVLSNRVALTALALALGGTASCTAQTQDTAAPANEAGQSNAGSSNEAGASGAERGDAGTAGAAGSSAGSTASDSEGGSSGGRDAGALDTGDAGAGGDHQEGPSALFVDPISGIDGRACRVDKPCHTLSYALTSAKPSETIYLQPGNYSKLSGETFTVPVPAGVTIESRVAGQAVLLSSGETDSQAIVVPSGATLRYLAIKGFEQGVSAQGGAVVLEGIDFDEVASPVLFSGTTDVVMTGGTIKNASEAIAVRDSAKAAISDVKISDSGGTPSCQVSGQIVFARNSAQVVLSGIEGTSLKGNLRFTDSAQGSIKNSSFVGVSDPACQPWFLAEASRALTIDSTYFQNFEAVSLEGTGIAVSNSNFKSATVRTDGSVSITDSTVSGPASDGTHVGAGVQALSGSVTIDHVFFSGLAIGLQFPGGYAPRAKVRRSTFLGNGVGINADIGIDGVGLDLGSPSDPGNNVFSGNSVQALSVTGTLARTITASGNTWDPSVQGADTNGHMTSGSKITGPYSVAGTNFLIQSAGPSVSF
jgi:hypothetical protein